MCSNLQASCVIFVPKAPRANGGCCSAQGYCREWCYDDAFDLSLGAASEFDWYCRSTGYNPYTREGKKTSAFEICEQLNWEVPDKVFVSVGDGNIISGVWKGF